MRDETGERALTLCLELWKHIYASIESTDPILILERGSSSFKKAGLRHLFKSGLIDRAEYDRIDIYYQCPACWDCQLNCLDCLLRDLWVPKGGDAEYTGICEIEPSPYGIFRSVFKSTYWNMFNSHIELMNKLAECKGIALSCCLNIITFCEKRLKELK